MAQRPSLTQFRDPELSLWQSAVDQVVAAHQSVARTLGVEGGLAAPVRPDLSETTVRYATAVANAAHRGEEPPTLGVPGVVTLGIEDVARFCAATAFKLARARVKAILTGDDRDLKKYEEEIGTKFDLCDPRWAECVAVYVQFQTTGQQIPYRRHTTTNPFVIDDGRLPPNAKVAILGDWGTGQDAARAVLQLIARRRPDVVIHLGDIYYAGTEHEVRNYFYRIWRETLGLPEVPWRQTLTNTAVQPATFTLSGNHDMYSGGGPYYTLIDALGQPASYFCLRNPRWQFIALDTGLHDARPGVVQTTYLEQTEADWLKARVAEASGRKTFLLSHHQLYSAFERFGSSNVNQRLYDQVKDVLPQVAAWFWGHEHNLLVYDRFPKTGNSVLGRCVGHAAFPVAVDEPVERDTSVPLRAGVPPLDPGGDGGLFQHGYVFLELDDAAGKATVRYLEYDVESGDPEKEIYREEI